MTQTKEISITVTVREPEPHFDLEAVVRQACDRMICFVGEDPLLWAWRHDDGEGNWNGGFETFLYARLRESGFLYKNQRIEMRAYPSITCGFGMYKKRLFPAFIVAEDDYPIPLVIRTRTRYVVFNAPADLEWSKGSDWAEQDRGRYISYNPIWLREMDQAVSTGNSVYLERPDRLQLLAFVALVQRGFVQEFCRITSLFRATHTGQEHAQSAYNDDCARFDREEAEEAQAVLAAAEPDIQAMEQKGRMIS